MATASPSRRAKRQYPQLDAAKFIAALLVLLRHALQWKFTSGTEEYEIIYCWLTNIAVPIFFAISGFLLFRAQKKLYHLPLCTLARYVGRIFFLYVLWSLLYFPFTLYFWTQENMVTTFPQFLQNYVRQFFLTSNVIQLWYLPALIVACVLVWLLVKIRIPAPLVLLITLGAYAFGCVMGYGELYAYMPGWFLDITDAYFPKFITTRNGVFYGAFFVALGMSVTRVRIGRLKYVALALFFVFFAGMYFEVQALGENDMVLCAAPATAFLFLFLRGLRLKPRPVYRHLRALSEFIYFAHALPIYGLVALEGAEILSLKPWPGVLVAFFAGLAVSAGLWALSRTRGFAFLRRAV